MKWQKISAADKPLIRLTNSGLNPFKSIRFPFLIILAAAIACTSFATYQVNQRSLEESLLSQVENRAHITQNILENFLTNRLDALLSHSRNLTSHYMVRHELQLLKTDLNLTDTRNKWQKLLQYSDFDFEHENIYLFDNHGQLIFNRSNTSFFNSTDPKIGAALKGEEFKDVVQEGGRWLLRAGVPILNKNIAQGALILTIDLNYLLEEFSTRNLTNLILADNNGIQAQGKTNKTKIEVDPRTIEQVLAGGTMQTDINSPKKKLSHYMLIQIDSHIFVMVTEINLEPIMLVLQQKKQEVIRATLLILAIIIPLSAWLVRLLLSPLIRLRQRVASVTQRLGGQSLDEAQGHAINRLIDTFDSMASALEIHEEARQTAEALLQQEHANLEMKVKDRTQKFEQSNKLLQREISQRASAQQKAEELQKMMASLIDAMPSLLIGIDHNARIKQWNLEAQKICGLTFEQVNGCPFIEVLPWLEKIEEEIVQTLHKGTRNKISRFHWSSNNGDKLVDIVINPLSSEQYMGAVIRIDDVTEKVRLDELIMQTEKMMSVGGLAAGMAHEINNPLASIIQNTQVITQRLSPDLAKNRICAETLGINMEILAKYLSERQISRMLASILESGQRVGEIVSNMSSFSRENELIRSEKRISELLDVAELLDLTMDLTTKDYDLKKKHNIREIKLNRNYADKLPKIWCVPEQLKQVFFNLIQNAAQAMSSWVEMKVPPQIDLTIQQIEQMLSIEISDNGPGIDLQNQKRIFEPFFTTKDVGLGTGLGLSVSYFIITENHQGQLSVSSRPGQGSCFKILLPIQKPIKSS